MKRAYRLRALESLYADLRSDDFDHREHALFQLALLLRRNRNAADIDKQPDYVVGNLPRDLLRLRLSAEEKRQAIEQLTRVIHAHPASRATAIWALGEAEAAFALEPLLGRIIELDNQLRNEAAFQTCVALARWLSPPAAQGLNLAGLRVILKKWASSKDARLANAAGDLLAQLPAL
ncbi:MAG: hypothetical protein F4243_03545 [Chloroflexi bacterium]|nr:hypothetical protein [Chloroflexota bacterium]